MRYVSPRVNQSSAGPSANVDDPDGSGKFTVMRYAGEMEFKIIVPEWAKQAAKSVRSTADATAMHPDTATPR